MKILLKIIGFFAIVILLIFLFVTIRFNYLASPNFEEALFEFEIDKAVANADIKLGKRIYTIRNGCIDCHGDDLGGVMVMDNSAIGTIHGANITPYILKDWSNNEIARAIRYGVHKTGRSLLFMPSFDYVELSLEDIAAVIAYVRSVPAIKKESHKNRFGPMAKVLSSFGQMPVMFPAYYIDQTKGFANKPDEGPTKEFGRYLAASCVGCHGKDFRGGPIPGGAPDWPHAANIRLGASNEWTQEKFNQMMKTGVSPISGNPLRPPMPIALLKKFNEVEKRALWLYLSDLK